MKPNQDFLNSTDKKAKEEYYQSLRKQYPEYFALTKYQRKCLSATNYWRVIAGIKEIPVPKEDTEYFKYFNKACYNIRKLRERCGIALKNT